MNLTNSPVNHTQLIFFLEIFQVSGSNKTPILWVPKLRFVLTCCPTLHLLVGLMHNSTTAKELKNDPVKPSKQSVKVSFVTSEIEKMRKKGRWFYIFAAFFWSTTFRKCLLRGVIGREVQFRGFWSGPETVDH